MTDKGYGNMGKLHKNRSRNSSFPYVDKSEPVEDDLDLLTKTKIQKKIAPAQGKTDFHSDLSTDKFYFVAGNTKLSDCFERSGLVIEKITSYARMFNPVPKLNKGPKVGGGSSFPNGVGNFKGIGMTSGFASAPPEFDEVYLQKYREEEDVDDEDKYVYEKDAENY